MVRASADPRSAMESKTSSMPLTVPMRPSSGDRGTSTRRSRRFAFMPEFRREIIDVLICLAHHER
jgi:hypothetical protein